MDKSKRQFLGKMASVSVGAALIPVVQVYAQDDKHSTQMHIACEGQVGKRYGMVIDLRRCVGCQACTVACTIENQPPLGQFRTTVQQYEVSQQEDTTPPTFLMLPRLCNHCENPPCIPVCPTGATFQRKDGIVVVNNEWCVGCGYCVQACPYDARFINHDTNTADKCTFCAHRLDAGLLPACVETCVGEARVIGDLNDPNSQISQLLAANKTDIKVLKPTANTSPRVFYIGMSSAFEHKISGQAPVRTLLTDTGEEIHHGH
ncbi:sulfate reduction electron transfer complex DsrMKJOP subunit DsrO [Shewanella septentrionalis]|uniref:4Fe-4S dicluster domain-containing protein n=1 Tax=Shewanella septentrionalis TaxID=2952223 RepID=A0A9X2WSK7_9GAMM|nr:4Fe-4S dicluster domain-containing protein [Shewanella septentrionalis]MCT7944474.1 4Fe-4S dicluster domain-containing protein [Shewanella septentrionalis]